MLLANGLALVGIIHVWWGEEGTPAISRSQGPEVPKAPVLRDTQPLTAFGVVSAKTLFSQDRTGPDPGQAAGKAPSTLEGRRLMGTIIIGNDRAALIGRTPATPGRSAGRDSKTPEVEVVRQGEDWEGFKVVEISNDAVVFQGKDGRKTLNFPD